MLKKCMNCKYCYDIKYEKDFYGLPEGEGCFLNYCKLRFPGEMKFKSDHISRCSSFEPIPKFIARLREINNEKINVE